MNRNARDHRVGLTPAAPFAAQLRILGFRLDSCGPICFTRPPAIGAREYVDVVGQLRRAGGDAMLFKFVARFDEARFAALRKAVAIPSSDARHPHRQLIQRSP